MGLRPRARFARAWSSAKKKALFTVWGQATSRTVISYSGVIWENSKYMAEWLKTTTSTYTFTEMMLALFYAVCWWSFNYWLTKLHRLHYPALQSTNYGKRNEMFLGESSFLQLRSPELTQFFVISDKTVLKWNIRRGHLKSIFGK